MGEARAHKTKGCSMKCGRMVLLAAIAGVFLFCGWTGNLQADDQDKVWKEKSQKPDKLKKGQDNKNQKDYKENLDYRDRIDRISRKKLNKNYPQEKREWDYWRGVRDQRPLMARKRTQAQPVRLTRWQQVLTVARGPITQPKKVKVKDK